MKFKKSEKQNPQQAKLAESDNRNPMKLSKG